MRHVPSPCDLLPPWGRELRATPGWWLVAIALLATLTFLVLTAYGDQERLGFDHVADQTFLVFQYVALIIAFTLGATQGNRAIQRRIAEPETTALLGARTMLGLLLAALTPVYVLLLTVAVVLFGYAAVAGHPEYFGAVFLTLLWGESSVIFMASLGLLAGVMMKDKGFGFIALAAPWFLLLLYIWRYNCCYVWDFCSDLCDSDSLAWTPFKRLERLDRGMPFLPVGVTLDGRVSGMLQQLILAGALQLMAWSGLRAGRRWVLPKGIFLLLTAAWALVLSSILALQSEREQSDYLALAGLWLTFMPFFLVPDEATLRERATRSRGLGRWAARWRADAPSGFVLLCATALLFLPLMAQAVQYESRAEAGAWLAVTGMMAVLFGCWSWLLEGVLAFAAHVGGSRARLVLLIGVVLFIVAPSYLNEHQIYTYLPYLHPYWYTDLGYLLSIQRAQVQFPAPLWQPVAAQGAWVLLLAAALHGLVKRREARRRRLVEARIHATDGVPSVSRSASAMEQLEIRL